MKQCNKCKEVKSLDLFYKDSKSKDGCHSLCKACRNISMGTWRDKNRDKYNADMRHFRKTNKEGAKAVDLKRLYGLSLETYKQMHIDQANRCKICSKKAKLVVDHCHASGDVRGLLCYNCNRLMYLVDDQELLQKAIAYKAGTLV